MSDDTQEPEQESQPDDSENQQLPEHVFVVQYQNDFLDNALSETTVTYTRSSAVHRASELANMAVDEADEILQRDGFIRMNTHEKVHVRRIPVDELQ